jgi:putative tryptophan/tyrosine transport system substrate-binding protein
MKRREFMAGLGSAAAWPVVARAQQPAMPTIGFLDSTTATARAVQVLAFRQGLSEAGFVEGRNVAIEFRWADGKLDRLPELADDLVRRRVAAIATNAQYSLSAVKAATSTIPTVFITGGDPVETGYATNVNQPAGNVTGISFNATALNPKRLELLHELIPKPAVIAVLLDPYQTSLALEAAARALGRQILVGKPAAGESDPCRLAGGHSGFYTSAISATGGGRHHASRRISRRERAGLSIAAHHVGRALCAGRSE